MTTRDDPEDRTAYARLVPITTRWSDNDVYGHVNNVVSATSSVDIVT